MSFMNTPCVTSLIQFFKIISYKIVYFVNSMILTYCFTLFLKALYFYFSIKLSMFSMVGCS